MKRRRAFNTKRKVCPTQALPDGLDALAKRVGYGGNPEHKRNPGDFGLTPPAAARPDKSLCDGVGVVQRRHALDLLRAGIRRGMISRVQGDRGYPHNVWSMTDEGAPLEAQLENAATRDYHGYPLPPDDPMHAIVIREWAQRLDQGADDA